MSLLLSADDNVFDVWGNAQTNTQTKKPNSKKPRYGALNFIPAVPRAHPGQSVNPRTQDYEALITRVKLEKYFFFHELHRASVLLLTKFFMEPRFLSGQLTFFSGRWSRIAREEVP